MLGTGSAGTECWLRISTDKFAALERASKICICDNEKIKERG